jgi:hypothetical protein
MHGEGRYVYADGRQYSGAFSSGVKNGAGFFSWPNGNRYDGSFVDGQREGGGVFFWRDGTVYRGQFQSNKQHGFGVKEQPNDLLELQQWRSGEIVQAWSIEANELCAFEFKDRAWMFSADTCINGLAHGRGAAVSLDGDFVLVEGHFVLGQMVAGELISIPSKSRDGIEITADG